MRTFIILALAPCVLFGYLRIGTVTYVSAEQVGIALEDMAVPPGTRVSIMKKNMKIIAMTVRAIETKDGVLLCRLESGSMFDFNLGQEAYIEDIPPVNARRFMPLGFGYRAAFIIPLVQIAQPLMLSSMLTIGISYNCIADDMWFSVDFTTRATEMLSISGGVTIRYILGTPQIPIALTPLIALSIQHASIIRSSGVAAVTANERTPQYEKQTYLDGAVGFGVLLFPHSSIQIDIAARYHLPFVDRTLFSRASGIDVSAGFIYHFITGQEKK